MVLLILISSPIGIANASVGYSDYGILVSNTTNVYNMSTLYTALVDTYGENYVKENILNETSSKIWWCSNRISVPNPGNFWINETDTEELRIGRNSQGWTLQGYITPSNVKLVSWNNTKNQPADYDYTGMSLMYNEAHNVEFCNFKSVYFGYIYGNSIENLKYSNVTLNHTREGLYFQRAENITVDNITVLNGHPTFGDGLDSCYMNNSTLSNIRVINVSDYNNQATGAYGLTLIGNNNIVHDYYINGVSWSGTNLHGSNLTVYNFTVIHSGHNGFEVQTHDSHFRNITVTDSAAHNFLQVSHDKELSRNNTYENLYTARPGTGYGILTGDNSCDTVIKDSKFLGKGVCIIDSTNITVINCTQGGSVKGAGLYFAQVSSNNENHTIIDSSFLNNTAEDSSVNPNVVFDTTVSGVNNTKLVNVNYERSFFYILNNVSRYYYVDILVVNGSEKPLEGTKIDLTNEIDPSVKSTDGWGTYKTTFSTVNGRTYLPNNTRENSPAIAKFNMPNQSVSNNYTYTAIITSDNRTVSLSGITPDSSWYRKDPNIPTYTITAIIPNTSSKGPQIIGFAPAADNPFNPGEKKNFRIWTNESLTEMSWYVDGSDLPVSKGSLNYTWPITEGNHIIKFIGSNANGPVNKTWYLGGSSDEPSVPGGNPVQEIEFSPADSVLSKNVSEKVDFSVSPDVFTTKEWYVDGNLVLNNTVSMSKSWSTAGTYNVTFSGSGSEDVLHTWTVKVVEEPKDDEVQNKSIITIAPEYQIIEPKKSFDLSIKIEPGTPISGTQLDFMFNSSKTSVNNVTESNLLKQSGANTIFSSGTTNNSAGTVKNIYGFILGTSNVSTPGTMATVNLTAGSKTGVAEFSLSNVLISDADSKSVPYTVTNATVLIDTAPVMSSICCPKSVDEKSTLTFKVSAKDADCDRITLSASGLPEGASFNKTSGNFTWTPAVGQAGVYTLTFEVSDGYLTDSENVTVTVNKLNNLPVINSFKPVSGSSFSEGERIEISVNASDVEGQALNYCIRIDGVNCSTGTEYVWETDYSSSGNHTIEVVVSDGTDEVKEQHTIYISECRPRWDVNEDGVVNILDVTSVSQKCGTTISKPYPRYDVNQDGAVNILDLTLVGNHFGELVK